MPAVRDLTEKTFEFEILAKLGRIMLRPYEGNDRCETPLMSSVFVFINHAALHDELHVLQFFYVL